jgi:glutamate 5-kinase
MINLSDKQLILIKVGSNLLTTTDKSTDINSLRDIVQQISLIKKKFNKNIILVTSGAIAYGSDFLGNKPSTISEKQAAASIGQVILMENYQNFFSKEGIIISQILITKDSLLDKIKKEYIASTFNELLNRGILPIVNENDTVSVEEIKFSDNDNLSAMVAVLLKADLQIFLTDIDGLFDLDPRVHENAKIIHELSQITEEMVNSISDSESDVSRGGMKSKIKSSKYLLDNNIDVIIANGRKKNILLDLYNGENCGTRITGGNVSV